MIDFRRKKDGVIALEWAALMSILAADMPGRLGFLAALRFGLLRSWPVLQVAARVVALTVAAVSPFLLIAAGVYFGLLGEFDINYYLKERPPQFLAALAIGLVLVIGLAAVLLRLFSGWFFALPLVLFEDVAPNAALRTSGERTLGCRKRILAAIVVWFAATSAFSALATSLVVGVGRLIAPRAATSLSLLAFTVGVSLLVGFLINLLINLVSTTTFASMQFRLYVAHGGETAARATQLNNLPAPSRGFGFT